MPSERSFLPFDRMKDRLSRAANDSDTTHFYDVIAAGELVLKVTVAGLIGSIRRDPSAHQYRLEAGLVRADGLGEWLRALDEVLTGPASEYAAPAAQEARRQLTETVVAPDWRKVVLEEVEAAANVISLERPWFRRAQLRQCFHTFVWIRNKTRGHGAPDLDATARMLPPLSSAVSTLMDELLIAKWPWAVVRRGMTGRFRVTPLGESLSPSLEELRRRTDLAYDDGVYIGLDSPMRVGLAHSDVDLSDFFLANGSFTDREYEALSYSSGESRRLPSSPYRSLPAPLPASETKGEPQLSVRNNVLTNMPERPSGYVRRHDLERAVTNLIVDQRRTVVTLSGRGGIGKTSLALQVLDQISEGERFSIIWWFSARDIDLLPTGPKQVKPDVLGPACPLGLVRPRGPAGNLRDHRGRPRRGRHAP
jgi:NB-ARC domain